MNLEQTQQLFWDLLEGRERTLDAFVGSPGLPASERVAIYAQMFLDRQIDALRETFPKILAALGDRPFYELAAQYLRAHPSRHPDLGQLGRELAAFLPRPDLADLARLEWARAEVFEAAPGRSLTPDEFAGLAQDAAAFARHRVQLIAALRLLDLDHDVEPLWEGQSASARAQPTHVVVWRNGFEVFHVAVEADEAEAMRLALAGAALGDVCGALEHPERAVETLQGWLGEGWIGANR
jgi:hypothetical protein